MERSIRFIHPVDGDVLFSEADGLLEDGRLIVPVSFSAPPNYSYTLNGISAVFKDNCYTAELAVSAYRNRAEVRCLQTGETEAICFYWFCRGGKNYWLGVDDVILCLENIWRRQTEYSSVFDDPFLSVFRDVNVKYGTKVHMHIYYETTDGKFNLSMFPDKYKEEFRQNSSWLRFTFHARCDLPDHPYKSASRETVIREGRQTEREICRFAGSEVMDDFTSQHWADSGIGGTRAFCELGYKILDGYFALDKNGGPFCSYYLTAEQVRHVQSRDFWIDNAEGIIFAKDDIVINEVRLEDIENYLDKLAAETDQRFMYLLIHEQYFYDFYHAYQPDYRKKVFKAVKWCVQHGYTTAFISDIASPC